jgi:hypothetical protein
MHMFKDDQGREWTLSLTVAGVKKIKAVLKVDLLAPPGEGEDPIGRLTGSPLEALDAIHVLIGDQVTAANLNREAVDESLGGEALGDAFTAFTAEIEDFFLAFGRKLTGRTKAGEAEKTPIPGSSPTASPESSDKTQTLSP